MVDTKHDFYLFTDLPSACACSKSTHGTLRTSIRDQAYEQGCTCPAAATWCRLDTATWCRLDSATWRTQDLREIFESIENIPNAPKKLLEGIKSWARGDQDPTWKKK